MKLLLPLLLMLIINIAYAQEYSKPLMLHARDLIINVEWEPIEIEPNKVTTFKLGFLKDGNFTSTHYDFVVVRDGEIIKEVRDSFAIDGKATHIVEFPSSGSFSIVINILDTNESVRFDLKVAPEFPLGSIVVIVTLIGITIVLTRLVGYSNKDMNTSTL